MQSYFVSNQTTTALIHSSKVHECCRNFRSSYCSVLRLKPLMGQVTVVSLFLVRLPWYRSLERCGGGGGGGGDGGSFDFGL